MTKNKNKKSVFNIISISVFTLMVIYFYNLANNREKQLSNKNNTSFTMGKIIDFEIGSKVAPWFTYTFNSGNGIIEGRYDLHDSLRNASMTYQKSFIGKKFLVKYSMSKPKYNEMYLDKPMPDSLLICKHCVWSELPF